MSNTESSNIFILLDKNHPPNNISKTVQNIDKFVSNLGERVQLNKVAMVPVVAVPYDKYPLSLSFLL
jgi:hypothetical protein